MNEGWASYWHKRILESLDLEQGLHLEFIVRHNQVVRPIPGQINPYHLGFKIWEDIYRRHTESDARGDQARRRADQERRRTRSSRCARSSATASFLRRYLTEELMREMDMFEYEARGDDLVIDKVSDEEGWNEVKETLIKNVGASSIPVIKVEDADFGQNRTLYLKHASRRPRPAARVRARKRSPTCSGCGDAKSCSRPRSRASARCSATTIAASRCAR